MNKEIKNYGLKLEPIASDNYIFGASPLSGMPDVLPSGDWRPYSVKYEPQTLPSGEETSGCTVWGGQTQSEILLKYLTGIEHNFDEQFNYNTCEIEYPGADPQLYYESQRKQFLTEGKFPPANTLAEFKKPRPMTDEYLNEARKFGYIIGHEWLWTNNPTKEARLNLLRTGLKKSPVAISVSAWASDANNLYINNGIPNNHWCVCLFIDGDVPVVFDTYDKSIKRLHPDHQIQVAKVIYVKKKEEITEEQRTGFLALLRMAAEWLGLIQKQLDAKTVDKPISLNPNEVYNEVKETMKPSLLENFCLAIRDFEGKPGDLNYRNNNPGNIKALDGKFLKFPTMADGMKALKDYVVRAATGKHKAYKPDYTILQFFHIYAPSSDNNFPAVYADFVAKRIGKDRFFKIKDLL